jgi:hypothetical protein
LHVDQYYEDLGVPVLIVNIADATPTRIRTTWISSGLRLTSTNVDHTQTQKNQIHLGHI